MAAMEYSRYYANASSGMTKEDEEKKKKKKYDKETLKRRLKDRASKKYEY